jgi:ubiquinone/menaquinone biosynthesis C-methylase UbiE
MDEVGFRSSTADTWDALAADYDIERHTDRVYDACVRQAVADLKPRGVVLECGCGTGLATGHLLTAPRVTAVHAVDFSEHMLETVRRKFPSDHIETTRADLRQLPYPDGTFDCVLAANVLQHLAPSDQPRAAEEIMRVLRPGGRYSVSVHHYSADKQQRGWEKEGKPGQPGVDYIFRYSRDELARLFPEARIRAVGFYGWPAQMLITRTVGHVLARFGHGHMISAHGKRPRTRAARRRRGRHANSR